MEEESATKMRTQESLAKRRRVRKGTRSCWECKRRKIRCIFASPDDGTCIGCQHRRAPCISQDMPENLSPARKGNRHLSDRISKVEDFIKGFVASNQDTEREPRPERQRSLSSALRPDSATASIQAPFTPISQDLSGRTIPASTALHQLFAAFPAKDDAQILLRESSRTSLYTNLINTQPHSKLTRESLAASYPLPPLPGPSTHPVILAKQMLMFAITLQGPCGEKVHGLSEPRDVLMRRLVTAAATWVTTKDEIHGTIESLICIILEGVYEVNGGNLRRAWAVYRRAMTMAQLMGLHRSPMPPLRRIDPHSDANPEFMWFRIVYMDRYLSLLLGLPQGTTDKSMVTMSILQYEPPLGQFERQLTAIACDILERNDRAVPSTTKSIDAELLRVSQSMPSAFWRPANFQHLTPGSPDTLLETVRLAAQVYYHGLLLQLHLPYMISGAGDSENEYSKMTCVNAGREIMTRFIAHRTFNPMSSCSRPVDFFAFLAAMTLLLAHLDAHHHRAATNFLAHQRLSDRAMLDQALERMDVISSMNQDAFTSTSANLIRRLLDIEADAAEGSSYTTSSVSGEQGIEQKDGEFRLQIPYLGVVKITRQDPILYEPHPTFSATFPPKDPTLMASHDLFTSPQPVFAREKTPLNHPPASDPSILQYPSPNQDNISLQLHDEFPDMTASVNDWTFQGVDTAFFDSLMRGMPGGEDLELDP
ncbi:C6 zinc finger domain protein [Aspergillus ellipticus CBS 707.79]|uniref:C6 zinc finger domain protein n=1 Tax=Aspergillus ellipticus CBS 707.79 TaxID=1448320 RepID=A0A319EU35_9EURO|nr:C6 zinc finger domain protein [Aspergillus ellipticus CBS 707.79]